MYKERRQSIRATKPLAVEYCSSSGRCRRVWHKGLLRDISDRGLCIIAGVLTGKERDILVRIFIPGRPQRKLLMQGTIISASTSNTVEKQIHIRFKCLSGGAKGLLREYIAWVLVNERGA